MRVSLFENHLSGFRNYPTSRRVEQNVYLTFCRNGSTGRLISLLLNLAQKENEPGPTEDISRKQMPPPLKSYIPARETQVPQVEVTKPLKLFLPMSKVMQVNGKDYMIIGDLGTGGSCKVRVYTVMGFEFVRGYFNHRGR